MLPHAFESQRSYLSLGSPNAFFLKTEVPRHISAWRLQDCVQLMLEAGADGNLQDKDGYTPLHMVS